MSRCRDEFYLFCLLLSYFHCPYRRIFGGQSCMAGYAGGTMGQCRIIYVIPKWSKIMILGRAGLAVEQFFLIRPYRAGLVRVHIPTGILGLNLALIR